MGRTSHSVMAVVALLVASCAPPPTPTATPTATPTPTPTPTPAPIASQAYTRDVWVVTTLPSPMFLLARFEEPAGEDCEARLFAHARALGANRLTIDRDVACGGSAYFVRPDAAPGETSLTLRGNVRPSDAALLDWVRARWKRPASLTEAASRKLCVVVQFTVSPTRRVLDVRGQPIRPSGDAAFDESVRAAIESAIAAHANAPVPPRDLVGDVVAYRLEFTEGDPRICRSP